ncbi:unnamed protein product [Urochloa humidicola]
MAAWEGGAKKDPAAVAPAPIFDAGHGDLSGVQVVGVDFRGQDSMGAGGGDLPPQGLSGRGSGGGRDRAFDAPAPPPGGGPLDAPRLGGGGGGEVLGSPDGARLTRPLLGAEHVGGAEPAPAAGRHGGDRHELALERPLRPAGRDVPAAYFQSAGGGDRGVMMRRLALLFLLLGAMTLTGEPDATWLNQFGGLLAWLVGCILLFLSALQ